MQEAEAVGELSGSEGKESKLAELAEATRLLVSFW